MCKSSRKDKKSQTKRYGFFHGRLRYLMVNVAWKKETALFFKDVYRIDESKLNYIIKNLEGISFQS
jgi:hypothetical protein